MNGSFYAKKADTVYAVSQIDDKVVRTVIMHKSFDRPFSKGRVVYYLAVPSRCRALNRPPQRTKSPLFVRKAVRRPRIPYYLIFTFCII